MRVRGGEVEVEVVDLGSDELLLLSWPVEAHPAATTLTPAERAIIRRIAGGESNAQIARARGTSSRTVANQVASLLARFAVRSRHALPGVVGSTEA
jgi:DNA-binding CsgD family transcriptional regulator